MIDDHWFAGKGIELAAGPKGKFILMLRLYWPDETDPSIIDGTWKPPAVAKVGQSD